MKILVIDDSGGERMLLKASLLRMGHEVLLAADGRAGIDMCSAGDPDLILLDVMMPGLDGYATARVIRAANDQWVPIIFLSGCNESADIEAGIDAGGDDYLTKPCDSRVLEAKIRSMKRIARMRRQLLERSEELRGANEALRRLVDMDGLTGIANRRRLDRKIAEEIGRCTRNHASLSVVLLDIDHFRRFNEDYGHLGGDECLKVVAGVLAGELKRPADLVARYGGEEFCIVLPETDCAGALQVAERMRAAIAGLRVQVAPGVMAAVTASCGVAAVVPCADTCARVLLAQADAALYSAKEGGRNMVCQSRMPVVAGAAPGGGAYMLQ